MSEIRGYDANGKLLFTDKASTVMRISVAAAANQRTIIKHLNTLGPKLIRAEITRPNGHVTKLQVHPNGLLDLLLEG
jgi:hypothetical protein